MKILTVCGSLRARSSNRAILRAYARLAVPPVAMTEDAWLGRLPLFNPDLEAAEGALPAEVRAWRTGIAAADAIVISTPEYAHALPGALKNGLDWLVGDPAFDGKAVAILHASRGSTWAIDSLREVLRTMSARIVEPACALLPLGSNQLDEAAILARADLRAQLGASLAALVHAENSERQSAGGLAPPEPA